MDSTPHVPWRVLILALLYCGVVATCAAAERFALELDIANARGGVAEALFDFGTGFWGENTASAVVPASTTPRTVRIELPSRPIRRLRLDPTADDAPVWIAAMRLVDGRGKELCRLDPGSLLPLNQIDRIVSGADGVRIIPTAKADDPMVSVDFSPAAKHMHEALGLATVGAGMLVLLGTLLSTGLLLGCVVAWRSLAGGSADGLVRTGDGAAQGRQWAGGMGLFLAAFGARLYWLHHYARPVPFWDEWEGDALYQLIPFAGGYLDWGALVMPQWEHRILLTRTITLLGTWANGEWDPRVAMTFGAAFYAATVALVGTAFLATRRAAGIATAFALVLCASLPFDPSNLLWGGQTQMYGLVLLAVVCGGLAASARPGPGILFAALAAGSVSLFTMGAGLLGPACGAGICLVRLCWDKKQRGALARLAAAFLVIAVAGLFLHTSSRAHAHLYATQASQFFKTLVGVLSWPLPPHPLCAALVWLPWIALGVGVLRRRDATPLEWLSVALGGWSLVNALALSYARHYEGPPFDTRFFTPFTLGAWAAVAAGMSLALRLRSRPATLALQAAAWSVVAGLLWQGVDGISVSRKSEADRAEMDHRIRLFLSKGDAKAVMDKPPHYRGQEVIEYLSSPLLQPVLPAQYRRALATSAQSTGRQQTAPATMRDPVEAGPLTLVMRTLMRLGLVFAGSGWLLCAWSLRRAHR